MTQLLQRALSEVQKLTVSQQDAIASIILDELADEQHWEEQFTRSQDKLAELAAKTREEIRAGRVHPGGIDEL
jgi:hypothetical protein